MKRVRSKPIPESLKETNSKELRALSEQLGKIIERTGKIEEQISNLESSKGVREEKRQKKKKIVRKPYNDSITTESMNDYDFEMSEMSPKQKYGEEITSQLGPYQRSSKMRKEPTLRDVLLAINTMRKDVSELATRQNSMKMELDQIRARLC